MRRIDFERDWRLVLFRWRRTIIWISIKKFWKWRFEIDLRELWRDFDRVKIVKIARWLEFVCWELKIFEFLRREVFRSRCRWRLKLRESERPRSREYLKRIVWRIKLSFCRRSRNELELFSRFEIVSRLASSILSNWALTTSRRYCCVLISHLRLWSCINWLSRFNWVCRRSFSFNWFITRRSLWASTWARSTPLLLLLIIIT